MTTFTLEQLRAEDTLGYRKFFMDVYPRIVSFACRFVDRNTAEDITQDSFIALWENRYTLISDNLIAFLRTTVQNRCLNYLKHRMVEEDYEAEVRIAQMRLEYLKQADDGTAVYRRLEHESLTHLLRNAIHLLTPEKCARACLLYYFQDYSVKEIADIMEVSPRTVEGYLYNGIKQLRKILKCSLLILLMLLYACL